MIVLHPVPRLLSWWKRPITIWWMWRREPRVYVPKGRMNDLVRAHEAVHVAQWVAFGRALFAWRYLFTRRGRMELEAEAFAANIRYRVARGESSAEAVNAMIDYYALAMKSSYSLWRVPLSEIRGALQSWLDTAGRP